MKSVNLFKQSGAATPTRDDDDFDSDNFDKVEGTQSSVQISLPVFEDASLFTVETETEIPESTTSTTLSSTTAAATSTTPDSFDELKSESLTEDKSDSEREAVTKVAGDETSSVETTVNPNQEAETEHESILNEII